MSFFIVRESKQVDRVYPIEAPDVLIGRGREAQLVLDNVSVSRAHARVVRAAGAARRLEDLGSQNGTLVGGRRVTVHTLRTGDRVEIGKFELIFIGPEVQPPMYGDRLISEMPLHVSAGRAQQDSTFAVPASVVARLRLARGVVAAVSWEDDRHVLRRRSRLVRVEVNGRRVAEKRLEPGDELRVGASQFRYELPTEEP